MVAVIMSIPLFCGCIRGHFLSSFVIWSQKRNSSFYTIGILKKQADRSQLSAKAELSGVSVNRENWSMKRKEVR